MKPYEKTLTAIYALIGRMQFTNDDNLTLITDINILV